MIPIQLNRKEGWIWITKKDSVGLLTKPTGKYLFFCDDRDKLIDLAEEIFNSFDIELAKVPDDDFKKSQWVLCVYDVLNRYYKGMRLLANSEIIYRGWKSDQDTKDGIYYGEKQKEEIKTKTDFKGLNKTMGNY